MAILYSKTAVSKWKTVKAKSEQSYSKCLQVQIPTDNLLNKLKTVAETINWSYKDQLSTHITTIMLLDLQSKHFIIFYLSSYTSTILNLFIPLTTILPDSLN